MMMWISLETARTDPVATAVATTLVLLDRSITSAAVIALSAKIIRVAGGAERRVLGSPGRQPLNTIGTTAYLGPVAAITTRIPTMGTQLLLGELTIRGVAETGRRPTVGGMTDIALVGCVEVPARLGSRPTAIVMTAEAIVGRAGIVYPGAAGEGSSRMAEIAVLVGRFNMGWDGVDLARCRVAVMTVNATVDDTGMVEGRRKKSRRVVADTAILAGGHMTRIFGRGEASVMARRTVIDDTDMVEGRRLESGGDMADAAIVIGRYVEIGLAGGGKAIVAACAIADYSLVVEAGVGKFRRYVTDRAILLNSVYDRDRNVGRICLGGGTGRDDTIVAARTIIGDTGVIEHGRLEVAAGGVAHTAILGGDNVVGYGIFAPGWRLRTVMAGIAAQGQYVRGAVID
jgi:hypothetical protein